MSFERLLIVALIGTVLGVIAFAWWQQYRPARKYRDEVIRGVLTHERGGRDLYHMLPGEHCASGYLRVPHAFSRGAEVWDGCWDGKHEAGFTIDFLLDGEDAAVGAVVGR